MDYLAGNVQLVIAIFAPFSINRITSFLDWELTAKFNNVSPINPKSCTEVIGL